MGSGAGGPYSGTAGGSQHFAKLYYVIRKMLALDKRDESIYTQKNGYFKNPTAIELRKAINGNSVYLGKIKLNGSITYVMDKQGRIIIGKRSNPNAAGRRSPHPTLIGGKNPAVQIAGIITFRGGKIYSIDNQSGHYRPNIKSMPKVEAYLARLYQENPYVFHPKSKWRHNK